MRPLPKSLLPVWLPCLLLAIAARPAPAAVHEVAVENFVFVPDMLTIDLGDTVRWVWVSGTHTTTNGINPNDPAAGTIWNAPVNISNTTFERAFDATGTFPYYCTFHWSGGMTGVITVNTVVGIPDPGGSEALLLAARPNPFTSSLVLGFELEGEHPVEVRVFDLSGRRVRSLDLGTLPAGRREAAWDGRDDAGRALPAGIYFVRLAAGDRMMSTKVLRIR